MKNHAQESHASEPGTGGQPGAAADGGPAAAPRPDTTPAAVPSQAGQPEKHVPHKKHEKEHKPTHREAELQDRLLRAVADLDNYRKRTAREMNDIARRTADEVLLELLPVLDTMERGMNSAVKHDADKAFVDGYRMARDQMASTLEKFGLKAIKSLNEPFDHSRHDAIHQMPSDSVAEGIVMEELRKGYMSGDRLLRPAQVVVSSGPAAARETGAEAAKPQAQE